MKRNVALIVSLLVCGWPLSPCPAAATASVNETQRLYLSGTDKDHTVPWDFQIDGGRSNGVWTTIAVPSCWELQGFGTFRYGHEDKPFAPMHASYRHRFTPPADWAGRRIFLVFDGVMTDCDARLNGASTGGVHQGAFYRFKREVTALLKPGQDNLLEVAVSDKSADESVNRAERYADFWVFGGIFRPVWLEAQPQQFIARVAIDARADGAFALEAFPGGAGAADTVEVQVLDPRGQPLGAPLSAPVATQRLAGKFAGAPTWTAETPRLCTAVVRLKQGATVLHEIKQRFGFRTIEVRAGEGIFVNGQRVMLKGVCRHSAWPTSGRTLSEPVHRQDIALMKEMNMNAVRMSHYPPDEQFLDLCDELGLYVLDELTGWQKCYDTATARKLVPELVTRDVNHPAILFWDNGNEGGWNKEVDDDFARYDPQQRSVLHPWEKHGGINTKHYPTYKDLTKLLESGDLVMPTEFLHGLYDGGLGAGLQDYWELMLQHKNACGGFLWVFADEGVVRADSNNVIDVKGNWAPDGILGPYREKEASFYTIKELWSPITLSREKLWESEGSLIVSNRYSFTDVNQCRFTWQLRDFPRPQKIDTGFKIRAEGFATAPNIPPGGAGQLKLDLPAKWMQAAAIAIRVDDPTGRELWTWVWSLSTPAYRVRCTMHDGSKAIASETNDVINVTVGELIVSFSKQTGQLIYVQRGGQHFSLANGPRLVAGEAKLVSLEHHGEAADEVITATYTGDMKNVTWRIRADGWVMADYAYHLSGTNQIFGVAFDYPETNMNSMRWLGSGPYRVWQNRIAGGTLGVWTNNYNNTITGWSGWLYPEFKGFYADVRWLQLDTTEGLITAILPAPSYVQMLKPELPPGKLPAKSLVTFPDASLAFLNAIPAIGNKFHAARDTGPHGQPAIANGDYHGGLSLYFGKLPE